MSIARTFRNSLFVLVACAGLGLGTLASAGAAEGGIEAFYGRFQGEGITQDPNTLYFGFDERTVDVEIGPDGQGFFVDWTTVILVGAMMPLSTAISETGAAQMLAEGLISVVGPAGPRALLAGLFVLTAVLGQVISNTATALIIIPISVVAALEMGVSPQPVLMSVAVAAAAAFLTPVATPTNLMVMEPGSYRFGDYWKFGLPFMAWFFVIAVGLVPVIWPF